MNALRLLLLISFLIATELSANAGDPVRPVELKGPKVMDQRYLVKKPVSNVNLPNQSGGSSLFNRPALYIPNKSSQSSYLVSLNYNFGRVINVGHVMCMGIIDLPQNNHPQNESMRKRDIVLVSAVSAICITGVILGPVINCKTRSVRYNKTSRSTIGATIAMNNELELTVKF